MSSTLPPDPLTLAYLAGVIDADGYITVHRSRRGAATYYAAKIGISGTRREPLDLAAATWGGTVSRHEPRNPTHRTVYLWSRTGDGALAPIHDVLPFLRIKAAQAWAAIEAQEHVMAGRGDDPWPWLPPGHDPQPFLEACLADARAAMVRT